MPIIHWQEAYSTGIQIIDDQHRQIFETINQLFDQLQAQAPLPEIMGTLEFLSAYAVNHFQTEESFMLESGYPDISAHQQEHGGLLDRIRDTRARFQSPEPPTTLELSKLVKEWMAHHIGEVDMGYASYMKAKGEG